MTEPPEPELHRRATPPGSTSSCARKNMLWGWALFGLFVPLFGGTVGVAYIYLWLS